MPPFWGMGVAGSGGWRENCIGLCLRAAPGGCGSKIITWSTISCHVILSRYVSVTANSGNPACFRCGVICVRDVPCRVVRGAVMLRRRWLRGGIFSPGPGSMNEDKGWTMMMMIFCVDTVQLLRKDCPPETEHYKHDDIYNPHRWNVFFFMQSNNVSRDEIFRFVLAE